MITLGIGFIYWPAGFIAAGLLCMAVGWVLGGK